MFILFNGYIPQLDNYIDVSRRSYLKITYTCISILCHQQDKTVLHCLTLPNVI
jgi:hypothetical protein